VIANGESFAACHGNLLDRAQKVFGRGMGEAEALNEASLAEMDGIEQ